MTPKTIVTHNSRFHTDDVFACATLLVLYPEANIVRSRDPEVIENGDIVLDVGNIYDPDKNRFDHHQVEGAGQRENGIYYASFGLIWKHFGEKLTSSKKVWEKIDKKLVQPVDAVDSMPGGIDMITPKNTNVLPYILQMAISSFNPTWKEGEEKIDEMFKNAVLIAKEILKREIRLAEDVTDGEKFVLEAYESAEDKKILILKKNYPWEEIISTLPEVIFVVRPNVQNKTWKIETIRENFFTYVSRKELPEEWGGKTEEELAHISGVADATFCHRALFTAGAKSKEGAIALAYKALES